MQCIFPHNNNNPKDDRRSLNSNNLRIHVMYEMYSNVRPPPPLECIYKGALCAFPFSRERWYFLAVCLGKICPRKSGKGGVFKPISREKGIGPLLVLHRRSMVGPLEGSGKIRTHISRARKKKKKIGNRGHHNVPEIGGQLEKSSLERGWILCGNACKRVRQFFPR